MNNIKRRIIVNLVYVAVFIGLIGGGFTYLFYIIDTRKDKLTDNGIVTEGKIIGAYYKKGSKHMRYVYKVEEEIFKSSSTYNSNLYSPKVGEWYEVTYVANEPKISDINFSEKIIKKQEKKSTGNYRLDSLLRNHKSN